MPDKTIYPVVRADGSGQSFVLSEYCIDEAKEVWDGFIDNLNKQGGPSAYSKDPTSNWPTGWGRSRSAQYTDGVADTVADQNGDGSIGYVETGYAEQRHFPVASVKNASGVYTQPNATNVTNALKYASVRPDGTHLLSFKGAGADVYYPSTYSYLIAQTTGFDPEKGFVLGTFLNYALTKGQAKAVPLGYAPLSPNLVAVGLDATQKIPGAPARPTDAPAATGEVTGGTTGGAPAGGTGGAGGTTGGSTGGATGGTATGGTGGAGGTTGNRTNSPASSSGSQVALGGTRAGGSATRGASQRTTAAGAAGSSSTAGSAGGASDPAVNPAVGPLGATGGEHVLAGLVGVALFLGGEGIRRRKLRSTSP
jgi:hypothetical protein